MDTDTQSGATAEGAQASTFGGIAEAIGARNLIIVIVVMPVIFIGGLFAILFMTGKLSKPEKADEAPGVEVLTEETSSSDGLLQGAVPASAYAHGAAPAGIALDGDHLALRFDGPDGAEVVVYDLAQERVVARIFLAPGMDVSPE